MKDPRELGGEELRQEARRADRLLGFEIERIRMNDAAFRAILDRSLALEDEINRRKKPREET